MAIDTSILTGSGGYIDYIKSSTGDYIFPITKIESIYDNSGNTLQSILDNKQPAGSYLGSSATAVAANKLATTRTLTIGNTGKSFDGSGNVSWSLSEIGAAASSHTHNYAGSSSAGGNANAAVKLVTARTLTIGSKGKTFDGSANISWTLAEIGAAASSHTHNYAGSSSAGGNANAAVKLVTARSISIGGASNTFNGTSNISWGAKLVAVQSGTPGTTYLWAY